MAHRLHIGQTFEDYSVFESAIERYQNAEYVQFWKRDSRTISAAQKKLSKKSLNPKLKYYEISFHCIQGGRPFKSIGKGIREQRWICVYPAYINSKKTVKEGRRIPKDKAVDNPSYTEIRDVCLSAGFVTGVENKTYARELDHKDLKFRGRIRIQLKNEDGTPKYEKYPTRQSIFLYLGETIPKLKSRQSSGGSSQAPSQQQQGTKQKKKDRKGRK